VIEELLEFTSGGSSVVLGEIGFAPDVGRVNGAVLEWGRLAEFVGGDRFQSHHGIAGLLVAQSDGGADNREPVELQGGVGGIGPLQFVGEGAGMRDVASAGESEGGEDFDIASRREAESCVGCLARLGGIPEFGFASRLQTRSKGGLFHKVMPKS
jgi:hypothetical protein